MARINYHTHTARNYNKTTITEKRAPTDESVRLLKEMEEAAREKLLESVSVYGDNEFNCTLSVEECFGRLGRKMIVHFTLNGQRESMEIELPHPSAKLGDVVKHIVAAIAERLAVSILGRGLQDSAESMKILNMIYGRNKQCHKDT